MGLSSSSSKQMHLTPALLLSGELSTVGKVVRQQQPWMGCVNFNISQQSLYLVCCLCLFGSVNTHNCE